MTAVHASLECKGEKDIPIERERTREREKERERERERAKERLGERVIQSVRE